MATLEEVIVTCLMTPRHNPEEHTCVWGMPLNIVGLSGGGKSERIAQACRMLGLPHQVVFPASKQPEDFGGAPFATPDGITIECILPQANALMHQGFGVLVIDELSTARPAVQAAALGVVNDRRVGDHLMPPRVRIICAMNPPEYAAGGFTLEAPLANRLMHLKYDMPSTSEWRNWLLGKSNQSFQPIQGAESQVVNGWNVHWSALRGLMIGFMEAHGKMLHVQPKPDDPNSGGAWPSPRMWNWAGRAIATARCLGMPADIESTIIEGCVGKGVVEEWVAWVAKADLPNPEDMLTKGWKPDRKRLDVTIAAYVNMTMWLGGLKDKEAQAKFAAAAWRSVQDLIDAKVPDLAVLPAAELVAHELANTHKSPDVRGAAKPVILELGTRGYTEFQSVVKSWT